MRPIDGETLRNTLEAWIERMNQRANATQYHTELVALNAEIEVIESAIDEIERMPTIEAEPVRHGQWVKRKGVWGASAGVFVCSVCNSVAQSSYSEYCPGCGAKMEVE